MYVLCELTALVCSIFTSAGDEDGDGSDGGDDTPDVLGGGIDSGVGGDGLIGIIGGLGGLIDTSVPSTVRLKNLVVVPSDD